MRQVVVLKCSWRLHIMQKMSDLHCSTSNLKNPRCRISKFFVATLGDTIQWWTVAMETVVPCCYGKDTHTCRWTVMETIVIGGLLLWKHYSVVDCYYSVYVLWVCFVPWVGNFHDTYYHTCVHGNVVRRAPEPFTSNRTSKVWHLWKVRECVIVMWPRVRWNCWVWVEEVCVHVHVDPSQRQVNGAKCLWSHCKSTCRHSGN